MGGERRVLTDRDFLAWYVDDEIFSYATVRFTQRNTRRPEQCVEWQGSGNSERNDEKWKERERETHLHV